MSTILLVEDEADNRLVIEDIFEFDEIGADLEMMEGAEAIVERARERQPILILMDLRLPGVDGLEATRRLKRDPLTRGIPVWAITAHAMTGDRRHAIEAGCEEYLTKPIDAAELAVRLRSFVSIHAQEAV